MFRFRQFEKVGAAAAAISDKMDGDCGMKGAEEASVVRYAREGFCAQLGVDAASLVCARQVHGRTVVRVGEQDRGCGARGWDSAIDAADGLATDVKGLPLAIAVADCVPVYLVAEGGRAACLLHAGRRGTLGAISGEGVRLLQEAYGVPPAALHAVIGPSAGPCCYEVSPEMAAAFAQAGLPKRGRRLDLWQASWRRILR